MQDTIVREITVKASIKRVYTAITDQQHIIKWFPNAVEGNLAVGESPVFDFGEYGKNRVYIQAATPHNYFAFRWVPGSEHFMGDVLTVKNTLVEFRLEEIDGMTKVTLTESGFASLPADVAEKKFSDNTGGWEYMIGRLEKLMNES